MPALKNSKNEAFCRNVVHKRMPDFRAYKAAGYSGDKSNASRLRHRPEIVARIADLQEALTEKSGWDAAKRLDLLAEVAEKHKTKDARVTVNAIAEANKMQGSYAPTKAEVTGRDGGPIEFDLTGLTDDQLSALEPVLALLATLAGRAGGAAGAGEGGKTAAAEGSGASAARD